MNPFSFSSDNARICFVCAKAPTISRKPGKAWTILLLFSGLLFGVINLEAITFPPTATVPKNALRFLGLNQYVEVPNSIDFNGSTTLTVEAWVNVTTFDKAYQAIVTKG